MAKMGIFYAMTDKILRIDITDQCINYLMKQAHNSCKMGV